MSIYENVLEEEYEYKLSKSENINPDIEDEELVLVDSNNIELANSTNMLFF